MKDLMAKINEGQNLGNNTYELKGLNKNQYNMLAAFVELVFNDKSKNITSLTIIIIIFFFTCNINK